MNACDNNTIFVTVAAWTDWREKIDVFLRSAKKQGVDVELLDRGEHWYGYYHHKIVRLRDKLLDWRIERPHLQYVIFTDARDVVFIKPKQEILARLQSFDDAKVHFAIDNRMRTWPMNRVWLAHRIALKYGNDGIINSGCYAGHIERVIEMLTECVRIHETLVSQHVNPYSIEAMIQAEMRNEWLQSDQFHLHVLQATWSELVDVDIERRAFACFKGGYPLLKTAPELGSNGVMPLGTAGILHSPWMLHRDDPSRKTKSLWEQWAVMEGIID